MGNQGSRAVRKQRKLQDNYSWSGNTNSGEGKYQNNGNIITSGEREETKESRRGWFFSVFAALLIPIIILFVSQLLMKRENDQGFRWKLWRNDRGRIVLWVVYFWMLILFALIAWYGWKMALTTRASQNMRTLIGALFMFWNLAGMVALYVMVHSVQHQESGASWAAQFPVFVALAALCWFVFGIVWFALMWRRLNRRQRRAGAFDYKAEEDIMPDDDDMNIKTNTNNRYNYNNNNQNYNNSNNYNKNNYEYQA